MLERLKRIVPEAEGRPDPLPIMEMMQATTREIAFSPDGWTKQRAGQIGAMFDSMAPNWPARVNELRRDALEDAFARGEVGGRGPALEVGSGTGIFTPWLSERIQPLVAIDLSHEMLLLAPSDDAPRVRGDASALPVRDGSVGALILVNCFLFPREADRIVGPDGVIVWVSTAAERTPIYLSGDEVVEALPGEWSGLTSDAGWGSWTVLRRS